MKITPNTSAVVPSSAEATEAGRKATGAPAQGAAAASPAAPSAGFSSTIQSLGKSVASGTSVDHAKVAAVSKAIADGTFKVDAQSVADKMVASSLDILGKGR